MTLTNPVQPRALSEEALGRMRRALFSSSRCSGRIQNFGVKSGWVSLSNKILEAWSRILRMSHAIVSARYSAKIQVRCVAVWMTLPLCASGSRLVAKIWKQYPSKSRSICLLSPASGIVSRANGQVRGKCTNSCSFSCHPVTGHQPHPRWWHPWSTAWGQCCTVPLPGHEKLHRLCQICPGQRPLTRPLH